MTHPPNLPGIEKPGGLLDTIEQLHEKNRL
jgi:hypothetical protein